MRAYLDETTKDLLRFLDRLDLSYVIAGGYPRDLYFGIEPKDMDIAVFNHTQEAVDRLREFLLKHKMEGVEHTNGASMANEDIRIDLVISTNDDYAYDFIFWGKQYTTWQDVIAQFDVNLNQFILRLGSDYVEPIYCGTDFGNLVEIRGDIPTTATDHRRYKMQQKALSLGWEVDNLIDNPERDPLEKSL